MEKNIELQAISKTLRLRKTKEDATTLLAEENIISSDNSVTKNDVTTPPKPIYNFNAIYKKLHKKFPEIINMDKPVLLAVGIRKEMSNEMGVSSAILRKWIAWYCRKSNYYALHEQGAPRFNLDGSDAGTVTEKHQEKMDKKFEKINAKKLSTEEKDQDISAEATNKISGVAVE